MRLLTSVAWLQELHQHVVHKDAACVRFMASVALGMDDLTRSAAATSLVNLDLSPPPSDDQDELRVDAAVMQWLVAPALRCLTSLQMLDLGGNKLGAAGMEHLAPALSFLSSLQTLDLRDNSLDSHAVEFLAPALNGLMSLHTLNLRNNYLGAEAMERLASALKCRTSLQTLNLRNNSLDAAAMEFLAPVLSRLTSLHTIYLGWNSLGAEGMRLLAPALRCLTSLRILSLEGTSLDDGAVRYLSPALRGLKSLHYLNLKWNSLRWEPEGPPTALIVDIWSSAYHNVPWFECRAPLASGAKCEGDAVGVRNFIRLFSGVATVASMTHSAAHRHSADIDLGDATMFGGCREDFFSNAYCLRAVDLSPLEKWDAIGDGFLKGAARWKRLSFSDMWGICVHPS